MKYKYAQKWTVYELSAIQKKGAFMKNVRFFYYSMLRIFFGTLFDAQPPFLISDNS